MQRPPPRSTADDVRPETILDVMPTPVFAIDPEGRFSYANDALVARSGYARDRLVGEHASVLLTDTSVDRCTHAIRTLLESGLRSRTVSVEAETANGTALRATIRFALLPLESGYRGSVGTVTALERASDS